MIESTKQISGGHVFGDFEGQPQAKIVEAVLPKKLKIPLRQGHGAAVKASVAVGDSVQPGQVIGEDAESISSPVHASAEGTVEAIETWKTSSGDVEAVVIDVSGPGELQRLEGYGEQLLEGEPGPLGDLLYRAGVGALGSGVPTPGGSTALKPADVRAVIVQAVHSEPLSLPTEAFCGSLFQRLMTGLKALRRALHDCPVYLAIADGDHDLLDKLKGENVETLEWLIVTPCVKRFPQDHPNMLCQSVLKTTVPDGKHPLDVGVVVVDLRAVLHVAEAVLDGKPVIERIVSLGGSGYLENLAVRARVGSGVEDVIGDRLKSGMPSRIIWDSIMTGGEVSDLASPISRDASAVQAIHENRERELLTFLRPGTDRDSFSFTFLSSLFKSVPKKVHTNVAGEHRACIACNYCDEVCPVDLLPHHLSKLSVLDLQDLEVQEELDEVHLWRCIECGLCSYVCPSKIDLLDDIQKAKKTITQS